MCDEMMDFEQPIVQCDACGDYSDNDGAWVLAKHYPELVEDAWICCDCKVSDLKGTEYYNNHTLEFKSGGHTIYLPFNTTAKLGNKLTIVNPESIEKTFNTLVEHYPVKRESLPKLGTTLTYKSKTLPETYVVCSTHDFQQFIKTLKENVDLITINDFLKSYPINCFDFELPEYA